MVVSITFLVILFLAGAIWKSDQRIILIAAMVGVLFISQTPGAIKLRDTIGSVVTSGDSGVRGVVEK